MPNNKLSIFNLPSLKKGERSGLIWLWLSILVVILDQSTKLWLDSYLQFNQPVAILPSFNLRLLYNTGAAWSILATAGGWQRWFLSVLALLVSIIIIKWLSQVKRQQYWLSAALALIIGGAIGNVIDRIIYGYVIDFIDIYYGVWHWPAFNVADSAISVGVVMLLIDTLRESRSNA